MTTTEQIDLGQYLDKEPIVPTLNADWRKQYYKKVLWRRGAALVLDYFLTFFAASIPAGIIGMIFGSVDDPQSFMIIVMPLQFFFFILLCGLLESSKKQGTWGKQIMKIQITDRDGYTISFSRAVWRNILRIIVGYSYISIITLVIQIRTFRKTKKLFHDQWSGTTIGARGPVKTS